MFYIKRLMIADELMRAAQRLASISLELVLHPFVLPSVHLTRVALD